MKGYRLSPNSKRGIIIRWIKDNEENRLGKVISRFKAVNHVWTHEQTSKGNREERKSLRVLNFIFLSETKKNKIEVYQYYFTNMR